VEAFAEKPDGDTAARYVADGYLWNSGNFLFRADVMLDEIARFEPVMANSVRAAVDGATKDLDFLRLAEQPFTTAPKKSIDYAVMERTARAAVIRSHFQWSDVGNWDEVWKIEDRDENDNATDGPVELLDTRGSLVRSEDGVLTTVVGCEDIIVISSTDAVLVIPRKRAEHVKSLVEILKNKNRREVIEHRGGLRRSNLKSSEAGA
jgi:mannose-1-phosphate guanylyltransferase / mannose-6-phosphate isomerase